jgi:hypothetical protein
VRPIAEPGAARDLVELEIGFAQEPRGAAVGDRVLRITTPGGASTAGGTGANVFTVQ